MAVSPARELAVLLHVDVVGWTSLVQCNEIVAHKKFKRHLNAFQIIFSTVAGYATKHAVMR